MFNITLVGHSEVVARFNSMTGRVRQEIVKKTYTLALLLEQKVKLKLSGQVLNVRTGRLRRSIHYKVEQTSVAVTGRVVSSSDVKYAAIHEFGGKTPAHVILPKKGKALAFLGGYGMYGATQVFAKVVHHPGSQIPARPYMRPSLAEMRPEIEAGYRAAVLKGLST